VTRIDVTLRSGGALPGRGGSQDREDDLRSLLRWVRADETLERRVDGRIGEAASASVFVSEVDFAAEVDLSSASERMGLAFDVLQLTLGSGISLGALAVSVMQWREARGRGRGPVVVLRRGDIEVEVPASGDVDAAVLAAVLAPLLDAPIPPVPVPAAAPPAPASDAEPAAVPPAPAPLLVPDAPPPAAPLPHPTADPDGEPQADDATS
jgi:Effector Associated Constant Component 1